MNNDSTPSKLIRLAEVETMTGLKKSSIYIFMRDGRFPKAIKLTTRSVAWREQDVVKWCVDRETATYKTPAPIAATSHTRHGWVAVGAIVEHEDDSIPDICSCNPESFGQHGRSHAERCANARLIAQAPRLLTSLRELLCLMEAREVTTEEAAVMDTAANAIDAASAIAQPSTPA